MDNGNNNSGYYNQVPPYGQPPYGQPPYNQMPPYNQPPQGPVPGRGISIAAMVCGIISIVLWSIWYISIALGIIALVLGIMGYKRGRQGMATAGIVTGSVTLGLWVMVFTLFFASCATIGCAVDECAREYREYSYEYIY